MNQPDEDVNSPPRTIRDEGTIASNVSNVTGASIDNTLTDLPASSAIGIGQPKTPPSRVLIMPSEELMEDGYDSDHQRGPFIQDGVADEAYHNMDEVAPEAPIEAIPVPDEEGGEEVPVAVEADQVLDAATINGMKVVELREELKKRGIKVTGKKAELQTRLLEGVLAGVEILAARPVEESDNSAGDAFHPGAYWKLLEPSGPAVNESEMTIDGVRFREPTMPAEEHELNRDDRPKKRNYSEIFDRAPFTRSALLPVRNSNGTLKRKNTGEYVYAMQVTTVTVPDLEYLFAIGIDFESEPPDWFNIYFPKDRVKGTHPKAVTMDEFTAWANIKAMIANAGIRGVGIVVL